MGKKNPDKPAKLHPPAVRLAIGNYHKNKLAGDYEQTDFVDLVESVATSLDTSVTEQVETSADDTAAIAETSSIEPEPTPDYPEVDTAMALIESAPALDAKDILIAQLQAKLEALDHKNAPTYHFNESVRLTVKVSSKCVQIALNGFYLNALMTMAGINKKGIPAWIQSAIDSWTAFDPALNVTEQVKLLIVRELETQLIKARR